MVTNNHPRDMMQVFAYYGSPMQTSKQRSADVSNRGYRPGWFESRFTSNMVLFASKNPSMN
jgi:hypothetical protein